MKTVLQTSQFTTWFKRLRDPQGKAKVMARLRRLELGHVGDAKSVGKGVSELRIHTGPGYRVYFMEKGLEIVVLLVGGDKSTQSKDIEAAQELAKQYQEAT